MAADHTQLRADLDEARRASRQSSYARRYPTSRAARAYADIIRRSQSYLNEQPADAEMWELMSFAQEGILRYGDAAKSLQRAMQESGVRSRARLKRLARLLDESGYWKKLGLQPDQLAALGEYLIANRDRWHSAGRLTVTEEWVARSGIADPELLERIVAAGGHTDAMVLANVVNG